MRQDMTTSGDGSPSCESLGKVWGELSMSCHVGVESEVKWSQATVAVERWDDEQCRGSSLKIRD